VVAVGAVCAVGVVGAVGAVGAGRLGLLGRPVFALAEPLYTSPLAAVGLTPMACIW
jgi:hypothetical protein